jgi:hypothetical protein
MFRATTGEGLCWTGEAVMTGSAGAALAKAVGAGEAEANERREACTKAREIVDLIFSSIYNSWRKKRRRNFPNLTKIHYKQNRRHREDFPSLSQIKGL